MAEPKESNSVRAEGGLKLRPPTAEDGPALSGLINLCPPLDPNSRYCNLLQCSHFADTAVVAELNGETVGAVTGYRIPNRDNVLFVWQVAVAEAARGRKLAKRMVLDILRRQGPSVDSLETTITADNKASWALFRGIAHFFDAPLREQVLFDKEKHFAAQHESELLCTIGPFDTAKISQSSI